CALRRTSETRVRRERLETRPEGRPHGRHREAPHGLRLPSPTVYFPHLVEEALMIEPTETETKQTLDAFVDALTEILGEDPALLHSAPHNTAVRRVDEVRAAREPILSARMAKARKNASL